MFEVEKKSETSLVPAVCKRKGVIPGGRDVMEEDDRHQAREEEKEG